MNRMTVAQAEQLVAGCESLSAKDWKSFRDRDFSRFVQASRVWLRAKCLTDFWYHLYYAAYYKARKFYNGPASKDMADWVQNWTRVEQGYEIPIGMKVRLVGREHNKTQEGCCWLSWRYARDPNIRALIRCWTTPRAVQLATVTRSILESESYKQMYPWVRAAKKDGVNSKKNWGNSEFTLERDYKALRSSSMEAVGHDKDATGGHFNVGLVDDYAVDESENSEQLAPQLVQRFQDDENLFLPGANRLYQGTIWKKDGFHDSARLREGVWKDLEYDLFVMPSETEVMPTSLSGRDITMMDDHQTFKVGDYDLFNAPDLQYCQARLTFESPDRSDTHTLVREVIHNDRNSFSVYPPIEGFYKESRAWVIGNTRPSMPHKFTLADRDILAPKNQDEIADRASLYLKRNKQGSYNYARQHLLNPLASGDLLYDVENIKSISRKDFMDMVKNQRDGVWYRKCDLSSSKETGSYTAILESFVTFEGVYCWHAFWGLPKPTEIMLELFRGAVRLRRDFDGARFRHTQFEVAHIETTVENLMPMAERDPYDFFCKLGGEYKRFAEAHLKDVGPMKIRIHTVNRGLSGKMDRVNDVFQPILEQGRVFIVEGCANTDRIIKEVTEATLTSKQNVDLLETLSDACGECKAPPKPAGAPPPKEALFDEIHRQINFREVGARNALGGWG